jgi:hypothetical protein
MALFDAILGGGADYLAAQATNKANREIAAADRASQRANQERGLQSLTGTTPTTATTRTPGGGFDVSLTGPAKIQAQGDIPRATKVNELTGGFDFNLDLPGARTIVAEEDASKQQLYDTALNKQLAQMFRAGGGMENTGVARSIADASGEFALKNRLGGQRAALDLLGKSNLADLSTLQQQIAAQQPQAPTVSGPGGTAANVIAQSPPPQGAIDLSGALPFSALGNITKTLGAEAAQADADERFKQLLLSLRTVGNQPVRGA